MNLYALLQLCRNLYACIAVFSIYFYLSGNSTEPNHKHQGIGESKNKESENLWTSTGKRL